jgi:hypothetical protein
MRKAAQRSSRSPADWEYRRVHNYHEWRHTERRDFQGRRVYATAVVTAASSSEDASANWDVERDGWPISRGHALTVTKAKERALEHLWKPARPRKSRE